MKFVEHRLHFCFVETASKRLGKREEKFNKLLRSEVNINRYIRLVKQFRKNCSIRMVMVATMATSSACSAGVFPFPYG